MKYKNEHDFAEKEINKIPFVQNMNIKVRVSEYEIGYSPLKGETFNWELEITQSFMDNLCGIINGLRWGYRILKKRK